MYYSKTFFYLVFFSVLLSDNHNTIVSGRVSRNQENIPLQGANILLRSESGSEYGASTDKDGLFSINEIVAGDYRVVISFIGYEDYLKNIQIEDGKGYKINAVLAIEPILLTKLEIISDADAPYENLPGAATVMDMKTLKLVNPIGTQEMLEYVPGVNGFADDGIGNSRISIGIRGLNPRRSSRVLILEDGVPIQPALYVYPNMYYNPPADRIDQIEVIKGSGTILYGPQTMGGVINYFTRRPRNEFGGVFKLTAGENGYSSLFSEIGGWGSGKLKPEIQLLFKRGDGFRENNGFEQVNSTLKLNYRRSSTENLYLKTNINYENSNATYTGLTKWSYDNDPKFNPKENDNFKVFRGAVDLIHTKKLSSTISKNTTAFISYFDRRWWREYDIFIPYNQLDSTDRDIKPYYESSGSLVRVGNGENNFGILRTFYVAGLEQSYKIDHKFFGAPSKLEAGWRVYFERFIDDRKEGDSPDAREGLYFTGAGDSLDVLGTSHHYESTAFSAYISESINFESFTLRPGIRMEVFEQERIDRLAGSMYQDKTLAVLLPGVAFSKKLFGGMLFGGIHRGFTPPSSGALKILNFGDDLLGSDLDLDSEKSWNKEIGLRGQLSIIDYEVAGFHIDIENLVAAGRGQKFNNLGKVISQGVEVRTDFMFSDISRILPNFYISYTFLDTEIKEGKIKPNISTGAEISIVGNELPYTPDHTLTVGTEFNPMPRMLFRADFKYVSEAYTDFENIPRYYLDDDKVNPNGDKVREEIGIAGPTDAYGIFNISSSYQINNKLKLFISGKNISDKLYIASRLHSNPGQEEAYLSSGIIPGPRRQINFGVEYSL